MKYILKPINRWSENPSSRLKNSCRVFGGFIGFIHDYQSGNHFYEKGVVLNRILAEHLDSFTLKEAYLFVTINICTSLIELSTLM